MRAFISRNVVRDDSHSFYLKFWNLISSVALLYAHRRYVVRALKLNRSDPLQTKYQQSILGSLQSANILLGTLRSLLGVHMKIVSRVAFFWTSAFSALVSISLVYRSEYLTDIIS